MAHLYPLPLPVTLGSGRVLRVGVFTRARVKLVESALVAGRLDRCLEATGAEHSKLESGLIEALISERLDICYQCGRVRLRKHQRRDMVAGRRTLRKFCVPSSPDPAFQGSRLRFEGP